MYIFLQPSDGAEHNRVADGAHGTSKLGRGRSFAIQGLLCRSPGHRSVACVPGILFLCPFVRGCGVGVRGSPIRFVRASDLSFDLVALRSMYGLHGGEVGGFIRRFCLGHGYAEQRAGGQNGHEGAGPLEAEPPAQRSLRLAERPPGPAQGAAAYRRFDVAVGEVRQNDRRGQAQGEQGPSIERHVELGAGHHEHRPVPEVDTVRAHPDPTQRSRPEKACAYERVGVDDGHDRRRRRESYQREPAHVEEGLELTEVEAEPDKAPQCSEAKDVEKEWGCPPPAAPEPSSTGKHYSAMTGLQKTVLLDWRPQEGERTSAEQPRSACICGGALAFLWAPV